MVSSPDTRVVALVLYTFRFARFLEVLFFSCIRSENVIMNELYVKFDKCKLEKKEQRQVQSIGMVTLKFKTVG